MKISIIIPLFNEVNYIKKVIDKVYEKKKEFDLEIIIVNQFGCGAWI